MLLVAALVLLAACGQPTSSQPSTGVDTAANPSHGHTTGQATASTAPGALTPVVATSELVVGPNRMALGLLENNAPITDAAETKVKVRYFKLQGQQATLVGEEDARYYGEGLGPRGTFIVYPTFYSAGTWGLEIDATRPGKPATTQRLNIEVAARGNAPLPGMTAPASDTPTAASVKDLTTITSSTTPDPRLYQMSVKQALSSGKPSVILFATPGFCQTAVCGPGVDVLSKLADTFGDKIVPVHVEVYQYPFEQLKPVAAMRQWGLQSEPWLFLMDGTGKITDRYEGGITFEELQPAVAKLTGS
jgi:hypothetical protein